MLFQITQICFNESDYATLRALMRIMIENGAKIMKKTAAIMVLSYYYLAPVKKVSLQVHRDKCCSLVKLLRIYFCYFDLLNHG